MNHLQTEIFQVEMPAGLLPNTPGSIGSPCIQVPNGPDGSNPAGDARFSATKANQSNSSRQKRCAANCHEKILVVDDEEPVRDMLSRSLQNEGYQCLTASSGEQAVQLMESETFGLAVCDVMMQGMSGVDLLVFIRSRFPDVAVLMVTGVDDRDTALMTFELGACSYLLKPVGLRDLSLSVANALEQRRLQQRKRLQEDALETAVGTMRQQVGTLEEALVQHLLSALCVGTDETAPHARRIGLYAAALARFLNWDIDAVRHIQHAATLHDVGKLGVPDGILMNSARMSPDEMAVLRQHTTLGAQILSGSSLPMLRMGQDIAWAHHEKWNGSGYPRGLSGSLIPESARIVAIVDAYDMLTHGKPGRPGFSEEKSVAIMTAYRDQLFDPRIFDYFLSLLPQMRQIRLQVKEEGEPRFRLTHCIRTGTV